MNPNQSFEEKILQLFQKFKSDNKRFTGSLLIALGIILGVVSRAAGGNSFQDFTAGILMGLSIGILLVGILVTLLSILRKKMGNSKSSND